MHVKKKDALHTWHARLKRKRWRTCQNEMNTTALTTRNFDSGRMGASSVCDCAGVRQRAGRGGWG
eukprot:64644-Chlamydomonas_euryale.AAC.1